MTLQVVGFSPRLPPDGDGPGIPTAPGSVPSEVVAASAKNLKKDMTFNR